MSKKMERDKVPSIEVVDKMALQQLEIYRKNIVRDDLYRRMSQQ